jgi:hypothetical protein
VSHATEITEYIEVAAMLPGTTVYVRLVSVLVFYMSLLFYGYHLVGELETRWSRLAILFYFFKLVIALL